MKNTRRGLDLLCTLSNMLWNSADRTPRKYRLTNTAGMWRIRRPEIYNGLGMYRLDRRCSE